jgi:HSP20 family protein
MSNVTRWDPFEDIDNLFKGFFLQPMRLEAGVPGEGQGLRAKMDVTENDKAYVVLAEIPGVKKEDIQVAIDGNQVSISAENKRETEQKQGEKVLRTERHYGRVYRAFSLAQEVDAEAAAARYENGVLELTLPKRASSAQKRLTIQ